MPGETVGLVGESGSGKSSIANTVLGLVPAASGSMRFGSADLAAMKTRYPAEVRRDIQAVFQDPFSSLNPSMTVEDIVTEPLRVHTQLSREERRGRAIKLLRMVSLDEEHLGRHPHQFSGGQRQRIAIASALALQPKLIVLDEPVSALDVSTQNQIINLLYERRDALGIAYLLIAHDLALVHHISDRIAVMYLGHIVEEGPADRVYSQPAHPYTKALLDAVPLLDPAEQRARRARRKQSLVQEAPRVADTGCPYRNRCPFAMPRCAAEMPPPYAVPGGGVANCFLLDEPAAPRIAVPAEFVEP
jgi:oligopeptide/dipeptide ABC transporter ATP-binding protein